MINCSHCSRHFPLKRFLLVGNPVRLRCPYCRIVLHAGRYTRRVVYVYALPAVLVAAAFGIFAEYVLGWPSSFGFASVVIGSAIVGAVTDWLVWRRGDFAHQNNSNGCTMETSMKLRITVVLSGVALLATLSTLAWALWQNCWWRRSVDLVADEAGASWAMSSFRRGQLAIWEIDPTSDSPRFSGRRDGPFEIWLEGCRADMPAPWRYAERRKVEAHNRQMRYMYEHPERFTPGQDERKQAQRGDAANRSQSVRSGKNQTSVAAGSDR